jgi:nicotinate-nucleotide--dimethylbenzimidazole phosphoribosyltransferase
MTLDQAHAAMRAGMEIGDTLRGNALICAGIGVGSHFSAALVLAGLTDSPVQDLLVSGPHMPRELSDHLLSAAHAVQARHRQGTEAVEVLAALGGFEMAMMVGAMLVAASKRHLLMIDGMAACAALMVASRIATPVTDYCVFCRSHAHHGLQRALHLFRASALLELGIDSTDGTGAMLAWPFVRSAAALLTEVADGADPGPSHPTPMANDAAPGG